MDPFSNLHRLHSRPPPPARASPSGARGNPNHAAGLPSPLLPRFAAAGGDTNEARVIPKEGGSGASSSFRHCATQISRRPVVRGGGLPVAGAYCPWGGVPHGGGATPERCLMVATWRCVGGPVMGFGSASPSWQRLPLFSAMGRGPGRA